jgi:hypothetical protein
MSQNDTLWSEGLKKYYVLFEGPLNNIAVNVVVFSSGWYINGNLLKLYSETNLTDNEIDLIL